MLTRKRVLLAKIEGTYGTDPTPTGAANAILIRGEPTITPMQTDQASRNLVRGYLGNYENLPAAIHSMVEFDVEIAGAGTAGSAPGYGPLLRACAMAETLNASAVTGTSQGGGTTTNIVLAAAVSASNDAFNGMVIRTTGGTGSGQRRLITDYVGATDTATINKAWDITPDNTTTYSIDAAACYTPISDADSMESVTLYFYADGTLHKLTGARGSVSVTMDVLGIPVYRFRFLGLYTTPTDETLPTCTYSGFTEPVTVNNDNTSAFKVHGYAAILQGLQVDLANAVAFQSLVGAERVLITDRKPAGRLTIQAPTIAEKDLWTPIQDATTDELTVKHGTSDGNIVELDAFAAQLTQPAYGDQDGVQMLQCALTLVPSSGNDELAITVR